MKRYTEIPGFQDLSPLSRRVVEASEATRQRLLLLPKSERVAFVKKQIDEAEVAVGVWVDPTDPLGVGMYVIKGIRRAQAMFSSADPALPGTTRLKGLGDMTVAAIPCIDEEQAQVAGAVWGDHDISALNKDEQRQARRWRKAVFKEWPLIKDGPEPS